MTWWWLPPGPSDERPSGSIYGSARIYPNLITFEGPDASGKSTQMVRLREYFASQDFSPVITREPGGTEIGDRVRDIILSVDLEVRDRTELMLFLTSRSDHIEEKVEPALREGRLVMIDRFVGSTDAYQMHARSRYDLFPIARTAHETFDVRPGRTYLLDVGIQTMLERMDARVRNGPTSAAGEPLENRLDKEQVEFHERVREGFRLHAEQHPEVVIIDAEQSEENVTAQILDDLDGYLSAHGYDLPS